MKNKNYIYYEHGYDVYRVDTSIEAYIAEVYIKGEGFKEIPGGFLIEKGSLISKQEFESTIKRKLLKK